MLMCKVGAILSLQSFRFSNLGFNMDFGTESYMEIVQKDNHINTNWHKHIAYAK